MSPNTDSSYKCDTLTAGHRRGLLANSSYTRHSVLHTNHAAPLLSPPRSHQRSILSFFGKVGVSAPRAPPAASRTPEQPSESIDTTAAEVPILQPQGERDQNAGKQASSCGGAARTHDVDVRGENRCQWPERSRSRAWLHERVLMCFGLRSNSTQASWCSIVLNCAAERGFANGRDVLSQAFKRPLSLNGLLLHLIVLPWMRRPPPVIHHAVHLGMLVSTKGSSAAENTGCDSRRKSHPASTAWPKFGAPCPLRISHDA